LLIHFSLVKVGIPGNLVYSFQVVSDLANFKLIPIEKLFPDI